jgi:quercetin dioxygenase-like cupin family protein
VCRKTALCEKHHIGYCTKGHLKVTYADGRVQELKSGDAFVVPTGHEAEVIGSEAFEYIEFTPAPSSA